MDRLRCSIELEPRTLNEGQLQDARVLLDSEAAMCIIQSKEPEEVSEIFTQVRRVTGYEEVEEVKKSDEQHEVLNKGNQVSKGSWGLPFTVTNSEDFPDPTKIREPLSSPF